MIDYLRTHVRMHLIIALYFEFETVLKFEFETVLWLLSFNGVLIVMVWLFVFCDYSSRFHGLSVVCAFGISWS